MLEKVGRYILGEELGRGGFGRVYRAFDPNVQGNVAVKVLLAGADPDLDLLNRFREEAGITRKLQHKNIVTVYDFGDQDGVPYLVMELLEGQTLQRLIASEGTVGLTILDKVEIMAQVAEGLHYAHARHVIHRDIKPSNIMVLPDGTVKIMDFGVARMVDRGDTRRTQQGSLVGTIQYMAPEQFKNVDASARTDVFAYGTVFYEILTTLNPFLANDPGSIIYRLMSYEPPPILDRDRECPLELNALVCRLIEKNPETRTDLADAILDTKVVLRLLRQARVSDLILEIRQLAETGGEEQALSRCQKALELDPLNEEARGWRAELRNRVRAKELRVRVAELCRHAEEHFSARRFSEAVAVFGSALNLDASNSEVIARLNAAKETLERVQISARFVDDAKLAQEKGDLEGAVEWVSRALEADPANLDAAALRPIIREEIRDRWTATIIARSEELLRQGEYDKALTELSRVEFGSKLVHRAAALTARIEADRADAVRGRAAARFETALSLVKTALHSKLFEKAEVGAEALCAEFPEEPAASDLLSEVREHQAAQRRIRAIEEITQKSSSLIKDKQFGEAMSVLRSGLRSYPNEMSMQRLLEMTIALDAGHHRAKAIDEILERANTLASSGEFERAMQFVDSAIGEYGQDPSLVRCKRRIESDHDQHQLRLRQERAANIVASVKKLVDLGELESAQARVQEAISIDPLCEDARQWQRELKQRTQKKVLQHQAEELILKGNDHLMAGRFSEAVAAFESALVLDRNNSYAQDALMRARGALEKARLASSLVVEAQRETQRGNLERALENVNRATELDPRSGDAAALRESVLLELRDRNATAVLAEAERLYRCGDYHNALIQVDKVESGSNLTSKAASLRVLVSVVQQAQTLVDEKSQIEEALRIIDAAQVQFGAEPALVQCRRNFELELKRRETSFAIKRATDEAERLLAQQRPADAVLMLEDARTRYPGQPEIDSLLVRGKRAAATARQREYLNEALARIGTFESSGVFASALAEAEAALSRYGESPDLQVVVGRLKEKVADQERERGAELLNVASVSSGPKAALEPSLRLAQKARARGDYEGAEHELRDLFRLYPENRNVARLLNAVIGEREEQRSIRQSIGEAASILNEAATVDDPENTVAVLTLLEKAVAILALLKERYPDSADVRTEWDLAAQKLSQKRSQSAERAKREAEERYRHSTDEKARQILD